MSERKSEGGSQESKGQAVSQGDDDMCGCLGPGVI